MIDPMLQPSERLRRYVRFLKKQDVLSAFFAQINKSGDAYLFGGAARDVAFVDKRLVNDLDMFVSGKLDEGVLSRFDPNVRRNNFGGYRLFVGGYDVDIWELDKSYAFRNDASSYISVRHLLKSVCFSTDAIAVSVVTGKVERLSEFDASFSSHRLDFIVRPDELKPVVATRIARLALKLSLELTPQVANYFVQAVETFGVAEIIEAERRWSGKRILNEFAIEEVRSSIQLSIEKAFKALGSSATIAGVQSYFSSNART